MLLVALHSSRAERRAVLMISRALSRFFGARQHIDCRSFKKSARGQVPRRLLSVIDVEINFFLFVTPFPFFTRRPWLTAPSRPTWRSPRHRRSLDSGRTSGPTQFMAWDFHPKRNWTRSVSFTGLLADLFCLTCWTLNSFFAVYREVSRGEGSDQKHKRCQRARRWYGDAQDSADD